MARPWQCLPNPKPETAFKLKFFSDSSKSNIAKKIYIYSRARARRHARRRARARAKDKYFFSIQLLINQAACLKQCTRARDALEAVEDQPAPAPSVHQRE